MANLLTRLLGGKSTAEIGKSVARMGATLADLTAKRDAAIARRRDLLAAAMDGNKEAQRARDQATREIANLSADIEDVSADLATWRRRLAEAEAAEAVNARLAKMQQVNELLAEDLKLAGDVAEALSQLGAALDRQADIQVEVRHLVTELAPPRGDWGHRLAAWVEPVRFGERLGAAIVGAGTMFSKLVGCDFHGAGEPAHGTDYVELTRRAHGALALDDLRAWLAQGGASARASDNAEPSSRAPMAANDAGDGLASA